MPRTLVALLLLAVVFCIGCDEPVAKKKPKAKPPTQAKKADDKQSQVATKPEPKKRRLPGAWDGDAPVPSTNTSLSQAGARDWGGNRFNRGNMVAQVDAMQVLFDQVRDVLKTDPLLLVWLVDSSNNSGTVRQEVSGAMRNFYTSATAKGEAADHLLSVVIPYGDQAPTEMPEPTADATTVLQPLSQLPQGSTSGAATFATLKAAVTAYQPLRSKREVIFVVVSAQRGSDWQQAEAPIAMLRKNLIPTYVVGWPAPMGKERIDEKGQGDLGPESRYKESIEIESLAGGFQFEMMDSGFGPFPLEWLAHATDGRFLSLRGSSPISSGQQFDQATMKKYAPDYVSEADYQALLKGNAACQALHNAAKLPRVEVRTQLATNFAKRNEAQFVTDISKAQQRAARLEPEIEKLYDTLAAGESGRAKLTSPRWQVQYDIAMGRACAAKARIDGYNTMLAQLKSGKNFTKPTATTWVLVSADSTDAGSAIVKLVERSQMYLKRVVADHPGTPWAAIAEHELQTQIGWKWNEE